MLTISILATIAVTGQSNENKAAIDYLRALQTSTGGFVRTRAEKEEKTPPVSLRTTRTALRAFRLLDGKPADPEAVARFLKGCHDRESGGFADHPGGKPDPISTSVALMTLMELKLPTGPYLNSALAFMNDKAEGFEEIRMVASGLEAVGRMVPKANVWLELIEKQRNQDGSYGNGPGKARVTALSVVTGMRLGGKIESVENVVKALQAGQRDDGGYGGAEAGISDLEACYRIVRALTRLGAKPANPDKLLAFVAACRNDDGGFGVRPKTKSSLQGTYYANIVRYWLRSGKEALPDR